MSKNSVLTILIISIILIGSYYLLSKPPSDISNKNDDSLLISQTPTKPMQKLVVEDLKIGSGNEVKTGDNISIHYVGTLENGTKFDSSYDRGSPFETQIGVGQVIKGWDEGVVGMKIGGKRKLIIPPEFGYGSRGAGNIIPPNSTLIFEVELIDIKK